MQQNQQAQQNQQMQAGAMQQAAEGAVPNFCPDCGTKTNGANFCSNCGKKLV